MSQKTVNAYERDKIMLEFVGESCPEYDASYEDYRQSLDEINAMIAYSQDMNLPEEVAFWRRLLMRTKMQMRELKKSMQNTCVLEGAYS